MALADFRTAPLGPFPPGTSVGRIMFTSGVPMEVRAGTAVAAGENGLGQVANGDLDIVAEWQEPATLVVVRVSVSDTTGRIDLFDSTGMVVASEAVPAPVRRLTWQPIVLTLPTAQAVRARIVHGGADSLLSMLSTQ